MPIRRRLIGDVSGGHLSAAMGLDAATNSATRMFGPLMGGAMLQIFGITGVYVLSAGVYATALLLILAVQLPTLVRRTIPTSLIRDLSAGVRFVWGNWELRRVFSVTIVFNTFGFLFTAMIPILGREQLGLQPFLVGFLSLEGFGAFIGALVIAMVARPALYAKIFCTGAVIFYMLLILYLSALAYVSGGPLHSLCRRAHFDGDRNLGRRVRSHAEHPHLYMNAEPSTAAASSVSSRSASAPVPWVLSISAGWRRVTDCPPRLPSWRSKTFHACLVGLRCAQQTRIDYFGGTKAPSRNLPITRVLSGNI